MKENLSTCSVVYNIWSDGRYCANPSVPLVLGMIVTCVGSRLSHESYMPMRSHASFPAHMPRSQPTCLIPSPHASFPAHMPRSQPTCLVPSPHTFIMGSVCSSSQPVRAWPASWNATTLRSAGVITLLFFSIPVCERVRE